MFDINIYINLGLIVHFLISATAIGGLAFYFIKNPDKLEALLALFVKSVRRFFSWAEKAYVKYKVQSTVNHFIVNISKMVPNLYVNRVRLQWVDDNYSAEDFFDGDNLVVRMRRSTSENRNIVNATVALVSSALLMKAKKYIAPYQKEAIDLFATTRILQHENPKLVSEYVDLYLSEALENDRVNEMYAKFDDIDKVGLFFPVFITEMTFLGEKVFGKARDNHATYNEVNELTNFLRLFAMRRTTDQSNTDFDGIHCKFTIRIMGRRENITNDLKNLYIEDLQRISKNVETIYIIGHHTNRNFIDAVVKQVLSLVDYYSFNKYDFESTIRKRDGTEIQVNSHLVVLRNSQARVFHRS